MQIGREGKRKLCRVVIQNTVSVMLVVAAMCLLP